MNIPSHGATARGALPTIGGRATPEEITLIDTAALELKTKRGLFLVSAAVEKAVAVVGEDRARTILKQRRKSDAAA